MDRRIRKTREAIFHAFTQLLSKKDYNRITVGEIIDSADIGRATFYAHFETKDHLLKAFCEELFCHIFDTETHAGNGHKHIFDCDSSDDMFLHLLQHVEKDDNHILALLRAQDNDLFWRYFKAELMGLIESRMDLFKRPKYDNVPEDFRKNHIASTFVETLKWWIAGGMQESHRVITEYFFVVV